jgi:hypothetical protein
MHIVSGVDITAIDLHAPYTFATSAHDGSNMVHIGPGARHVRFISGSLENAYSYITPNSKALRIDAGAKDIFFDRVRVGDADFNQNVALSSSASRVRLDLIHGTIGGTQDLWSRDTRTAGVIPTLSNASYNPSVRGGDVFQVATSHNIGDFIEGYPGQIITLLIPPGSQVVSGYGLQLTGNASFSPTHHSTMQFVFDGTTWRELSRSESGAS